MGWIRRRPDRPSPWRAGYRGPDGREHSKAFERKVDAERWLRTELQKQDLGIWVDPEAGSISVEEWSAIWMSGRVGLTEKTRAGYQGILNSRVLPSFGAVPLKKMARTAVSIWVSEMSAEGLSSSRVRNCFNVLAACLDAAVNEGLIGRNPARGVELPARPVDIGHRYLTAEQVDRLASAATSIADHSLILTLAYGGLRWGEAVALQRGRVDVLRRRLSIAEAATEVSGRLVFGEPKTHRRRHVYLPAFVAEELAQHLHDRPSEPETLVWAAPLGGPLRYNPYRSRVWDKAVTEAGLEGVTPHALRHTCASLMRAAGADVKEIQAQLGHRSPVVTLSVYTHLFEDAYDSVMDRLDTDHRDLVRPKSGPNVVELPEQRLSQASDQGV
jgi:integrase